MCHQKFQKTCQHKAQKECAKEWQTHFARNKTIHEKQYQNFSGEMSENVFKKVC